MNFLAIQTRTPWGRTLESFAGWCAPQPGWQVLDAGCGPGLLPALFAALGCQAYGTDLDFTSLAAGLHPGLVQAAVERLPFPTARFDLLTASNLLFLLPDPASALAEMARVLRPGGQIALLNPSEHMSIAAAIALANQRGLQGLDRDSLLGWASRAETHNRWSETDLQALFAPAGLQIVETSLRVGPGLARWVKTRKVDQNGSH